PGLSKLHTFGLTAVLKQSLASDVPSAGSAYAFNYGHQGGRYDAVAGLYHFGARDLNPALGRWVQQDPIGFGGGGVNRYRAEGDNPGNGLDPNGLDFYPEEGPAPGRGPRIIRTLRYRDSYRDIRIGTLEWDIANRIEYVVRNGRRARRETVETQRGRKTGMFGFKKMVAVPTLCRPSRTLQRPRGREELPRDTDTGLYIRTSTSAGPKLPA